MAIQIKQRIDLPQEEISNLLYQHLRISINSEEAMKSKLDQMRKECEEKNYKIQVLRLDNEDLKKRNEKLKK